MPNDPRQKKKSRRSSAYICLTPDPGSSRLHNDGISVSMGYTPLNTWSWALSRVFSVIIHISRSQWRQLHRDVPSFLNPSLIGGSKIMTMLVSDGLLHFIHPRFASFCLWQFNFSVLFKSQDCFNINLEMVNVSSFVLWELVLRNWRYSDGRGSAFRKTNDHVCWFFVQGTWY